MFILVLMIPVPCTVKWSRCKFLILCLKKNSGGYDNINENMNACPFKKKRNFLKMCL